MYLIIVEAVYTGDQYSFSMSIMSRVVQLYANSDVFAAVANNACLARSSRLIRNSIADEVRTWVASCQPGDTFKVSSEVMLIMSAREPVMTEA